MSPQLPRTEDPNNVKQSNESKGMSKKRKSTGQNASKKASKRPRSENKTLKPTVSVGAVHVDSSNHKAVLTDVGKGHKKARKKPVKKNRKKLAGGKKKNSKPRQSSEAVAKGNLSIPSEAFAEKIVGHESSDGFHGPREGNDGGVLSKISASQMHRIDKEEPHDGNRQLQEETKRKVHEEHVPVLSKVSQERLINWEHFALMYEEYCLTTEVIKR